MNLVPYPIVIFVGGSNNGWVRRAKPRYPRNVYQPRPLPNQPIPNPDEWKKAARRMLEETKAQRERLKAAGQFPLYGIAA